MKFAMRIILAFLFAPLVPVAVAAMILIVGDFFDDSYSVFAIRDRVELVGGYGLIFSYASALLFGVPLYLILRWIGLINWYVLLIVPACIGGVFGVLFSWGSSDATREVFMFAAFGASAGLAFWLVHGPGRKAVENVK